MDIPTPEQLKERRGDVGVTQTELAELAGVSQPLIARIEGGDVDPRMSTLRAVVEALDELERETVVLAADIYHEGIVSVAPDDSVADARDRMTAEDYDQLPVLKGASSVGSISLADILQAKSREDSLDELDVRTVMSPSFPVVSPEDRLDRISGYLQHSEAVMVTEGERVVGIITEADVAATLS
ncbi:CBS domain-containing protein [Halobaculum sp. MBLA0147]|uniref:CBS domain-containing protein n=1 Tax=Halobaculum sp. MBLA0147 TaxID=3079934 RepID=UPI0035241831